MTERFDDSQTLYGSILLLALGCLDGLLKFLRFSVKIDLFQEVAYRRRSHTSTEVLSQAEGRPEPIFQFTEDRLIDYHVLRLHLLERLPRLPKTLGGVFHIGLGVCHFGGDQLFQFFFKLFTLIFLELLYGYIDRLNPEEVLITEVGLLSAFQVLKSALQGLGQLLGSLLLLRYILVEYLVYFFLQFCKVLLARFFINPCDHTGSKVENFFKLLGRNVEQITDATWDPFEKPDVGNRSRQIDMSHALPANPGTGYLNTAALTDDSLVPDPLVLAAVALPIFGWPEYAFAEKTVFLWLQGAVVDRLGLNHFTGRPGTYLLA